jgi:acetyltransferase-like isoleucine patch superfamily enzyme/ribosomal protein S18 acetylase RimI-like enzyme
VFQDIKNRITETEVGAIIALAALDGTPAGTANEVVKYQSSDKLRFCGWVENDSVVGICGFEVHADKVEIHLVAVAADKQRQGVGGRMITALQKNYSLPIAAETDDDAVGFYRKRGFETTAFQRTKWGATRHACVLGLTPNPNNPLPVPGFDVTYVKPTITRPNILVGDFTYYSGLDFESRVTHHYEFYGDRLIIGKFCQIAADVTFVMNGANHRMNAVSTFPFYILEHWKQDVPPLSELPVKGDTVIGNDVWIGQNATILPGVHIGNGTITG